MDDPLKRALLETALSAAVPLWVPQVRGYSREQYEARRRACTDLVASKGDLILYRSQKAGGSADAFNALAEALAVLSFAPGGVRFLGLYFETKRDGSECF